MGFFNWIASIFVDDNYVGDTEKNIIQTIDGITFYTVESNACTQYAIQKYAYFHENTWKSFNERYVYQDIFTVDKYFGYGPLGDRPRGYIIYKNGAPYMRTKVGDYNVTEENIYNIVKSLNLNSINIPIRTFGIYRCGGNEGNMFKIFIYKNSFSANIYSGGEDCGVRNLTYKNTLLDLYTYLSEYKQDAFGVQIMCDTDISDYLFFKSLKEFREYIENEIKV